MTPVSSPLICQVMSCKIPPDLTLYVNIYLLLHPYQMCVPAAVSFCTMFCTFRGLTLTSQETRRAWPLLYNLERASRLAPASFVCLDAATSEYMRPFPQRYIIIYVSGYANFWLNLNSLFSPYNIYGYFPYII